MSESLTREWLEVLERDYNHPCIVTWVCFNESWGVPDLPHSEEQQHLVAALYHLTKSLDATRPVVGNDGWEHVIAIEKLVPGQLGVRYPQLTAGKRRCPPEDCGGIWGYAHLLEALGNPKHRDHKEMKSWHEGTIDPEEFDLEELNAALGRTVILIEN